MKRYIFSSSSPIPKMVTWPKDNWCHWSDARKVIKRAEIAEHQLATCAAGPWRYDVENAPRGEYWAHVSNPGQTQRYFSVVALREYWQLPHSGLPVMVHAFAVPNPPQKTGD